MSGLDLEEHSYVKVLYDFQYKTAEGRDIVIKKHEKLYLLQKTNADWWQVIRNKQQRSFYVPATYVREVSSKTSRKTSREDKAFIPLDASKYKNMPKETSSAMKNVKKWLAGSADGKQEASKSIYVTDESHKHNAMDYATRAELKVGLAAIKTKSLERDNVKEISDHKESSKDKKVLKEEKKKTLTAMNVSDADQNNVKISRSFSTSPKSFDLQSRMEMTLPDPFRQELESSLDRRRKKSDNPNYEKFSRESRDLEVPRKTRIRTKSSHSDDSQLDSDIDDKFLLRNNKKSRRLDKPESKLSVSLHDELSSDHQNPSISTRNSRSLDLESKQFCMRTERSLSPKLPYGRQLTLVGQATDEEANGNNSGDYKILNDKRRTWAVEELMSELTQMCKERKNISKKPNFQLKSTEIKDNFNPVDELTKELHEINLQRSETNTPQIEHRSNDIKLVDAPPSNICKISINSENKPFIEIDSSTAQKSLKEDDEYEDITEHLNISETSDISDSSTAFRFPKQENQLKFTIRTEIIPQSKPLRSPKSPKILDEYNEANILNDCSPDDSFSDNRSLSLDKRLRYRKCTTNEPSYSTTDNDHESGYSNIKIHSSKVKMRSKIKSNNSSSEFKLTPSLEKLASEIQFLPARRTSIDKTKNTTILSESMSDGDAYDDSGIHEDTYRSEDSWNGRRHLKYSNSFKSKREGRYFNQREFSDEEEEMMANAKKCSLKKSSTLHFTTIPDNYQRFRNKNDFASTSINALKRKSRSLSDFRCLEEEIIIEYKNYPQESPKSKPIPLPRTKVPLNPEDLIPSKVNDKIVNNAEQVKIPAPRKISKRMNNSTENLWDRFNSHGMTVTDEINIESSTAVGFKTLLCTSDSGSDNCLQSKELLSNNDDNDDNIKNQIQDKSSSNMNLNKNKEKLSRDSPSDDHILSSNASSEALQSQSESEVTAAFDASSQPSPVNARVAQDGYECTINLPPGWTQKYDPHTDQICFVNEQGNKWFSSNDDEGKIYFFEENSNESSWVLPTITAEKMQTRTAQKEYPSLEESSISNEFSQCENVLSGVQHGNQSIINRDLITKKAGSLLNDWPQLSFDGNMRILKEGPLSRTKITENGKKLRKNWNTSYAVLTELFLLFFKDSKTFNTMMKSGQSPMAKPDISVDLNGASIEPGERVSSRKNVYMIGTVLGLQVLIQSDNTSVAAEWFQEIHGVIQKLPFSLTKIASGPSETRKVSNCKSPSESNQSEDSKKSSKVIRSRSMKTVKKLDDSLEDLSVTPAERQTKIKAKLRRFFLRRPTVESLVKNGIYKDEPAFGSYLKDVCPTEPPRVPIFVKICIEVLESNEENMKTDGLYRASGNLSQIQKIRLQVDQYKLNVLHQEEDVHVLTGALKLFFRELKEPLIPSSFFKEALNASMLKKTSAKVQCFREIVKALPPPNYDTLQFLLKHLLKVTSYQDYNRMHIPNLAIVFGPTLMWPAEESANMALDLMQQNLVIECLLSEYNQIFK
ncbi:uncharacterized protein [Chelonus insularis]|uniref:uncharacterized protein isoform X2 n=1 Tax=Chelonus insularis TaxID=460826 RepID=UPI001589EEB9|nr:uncharacterized protein LOC118071207 isoform X2 [Chelonus insularis]